MANGDQNLNTQEMNAETSPHWAITGSANCLAIGTRVAEFEITGVVGEGGFGNVYLAFDHSLQRTVAIKEYMPVALASRGADNAVLVQTKRHRETFETGMNSFINEARLLAQFDHPALIKVYRFWEQNNTAYMAMRYYEGQTFKNIVTKTPEIVTEAWLRPILKPLLEALDVLYKIQILHRDISPDNIMIQTTGEAVLLDFGAARQILGDMTQALTVILKPGYAPVEQYAEDSDMQQGPWTDIYALCAVMYWAVTKNPPPTSVTRMLKDPIERLQNTPRAGFSKEFLAAIDRGMAVKPQDRPQSIAEFSKLLDIDKTASVAAIPLPTAKSSSNGKKPDSADKAPDRPADAREGHKAKVHASKAQPGAKVVNSPKKKVSTKGSWILVAAGIVVAVAGIYRMTRHEAPPAITADASQSASAKAGNNDDTLPSTAQTGASNPEGSAGKTDTNSTNAEMPGNNVANVKSQATDKSAPVGEQKTADNPSDKKDAHATPATDAPKGKETVAATNDKPATNPTATTAASTSTPDAAQAEEPKITGVFKLAVQPWANVYVDGTLKGVTPPLKRLTLPEGKHQIRLVNPSFPDHTVDIIVSNKKKIGVVDYEFQSH
jgi:serine/threonine protein kinase